jgi:tRNA threonylcarbamoyladenosine biosynthesis protein TsaB
MKILAIECSSEQKSVAALDSESAAVAGCVTESEGRSVRPLGMIEAALAQAQWEREDVECLAIGLGPGSYTGIRVAISLAQGWQLARGIKIVGISSIECMASRMAADGISGTVNIVVDAQRNEFYVAQYGIAARQFSETEPLRIATMSEMAAKISAGERLIGPGVTRWFAGKTVPGNRFAGTDIFPGAADLATLASHRTRFVAGEKLEPIYLREVSFVKAPPPRIIL